MVFSSLTFIFFILPLFLLLDFQCRGNTNARNIVLIAVSLLFYTWGSSKHLIILILFGILNFIFGKFLQNTILAQKHKNISLTLLILFCTINILGLAYYKYLFWLTNLIAQHFETLSWLAGSVKDRELPLGISFFTFHALSFLIDIYRGTITEKVKPTSFLAYFFMFPHLVAGPIVRYVQVQSDLTNRTYDKDLFMYGMYRFIIGLNKKLLIANLVAPIADTAFQVNPEFLTAGSAWIGIIAYALQIYFDFSAYSDMAIGLAAMAGFKFSENFNAPYTSHTVREFWRRWHISLSSWLRDYIYIPLGGSRCSTLRTYTNLVIVFFICGLWHGANVSFIVWGLYYGFFLILERVFLENLLNKGSKVISRVYLITTVLFGWVFFRAEDMDQAFSYALNMLQFDSFDLSILDIQPFAAAAFITGATIALFPLKYFSINSAVTAQINTKLYVVNTLLLPLSILTLYFGARNPFIYFNF